MAVSYILDKSELFVLLSLMNISAPDVRKFCEVSYNKIQDKKIMDSLEKKSFLEIKQDNSVSISPVIWFLLKKTELSDKYIDFYDDNCIVYCCDDFFIVFRIDNTNQNSVIITPLENKIQLDIMISEKNMKNFNIVNKNKEEDYLF